MKFLRYVSKPEFSWFEAVALVALLALTNSLVIFLVGGLVIGIFTGVVNGFINDEGGK